MVMGPESAIAANSCMWIWMFVVKFVFVSGNKLRRVLEHPSLLVRALLLRVQPEKELDC